MVYARMNLFQRLTLQWDGLHPYNAAQLMRVRPPHTPDHIEAAWKAALLALGLGGIDRRAGRYRHIALPSPVTLLPPGADVDGYVSSQMNTRFDLDCEGPFRAFMVPGRDSQTLGIIYHHWVADSISIRVLMREWFYRIIGEVARNSHVPVLGASSALRDILGAPAAIAAVENLRREIRTVRRLPAEVMQNLTVAHRLVEFPEHTAAHLRAAAHDHGAKVTDLLLASMARVCDRHLPAHQSRRRDLAVGSIRDLRESLKLTDADSFGAALGFLALACPAAVLQDRTALLHHIAAERRRQGKPGPNAGRGAWLATVAGAFLNRRRLLEFYRKRVPVSAGLSNVDLSKTWVGRHRRDHIASFHRVSPTGPCMPLAIAPTTLGSSFNISFTWRQSVFAQTAIAAFIDDLVEDIYSWTTRPETLALYESAA